MGILGVGASQKIFLTKNFLYLTAAYTAAELPSFLDGMAAHFRHPTCRPDQFWENLQKGEFLGIFIPGKVII